MLGGDAIWTPETAPLVDVEGESLWDALSSQVAAYQTAYADWVSGNGEFELSRLADEAYRVRVLLGQARQARLDAGDLDGAAALVDAIAEADTLRETLQAAQDQASQYAGTWETLASWLGSIGSWFGLGLLPLVPLGLTVVGATAAVSALLYVVTTWHTARDKVALLTDLANRVQSGALTAAEAQVLTEALAEPSGGFFSGLGTVGLVAAGLAAVVLLRK